MNENNKPIQTLVNTSKILDLINSRSSQGVREISKELDIPKSTVFRILKTLEQLDMVICDDNDKYLLGQKFLEYRYGSDNEKNLINICKLSMKRFSEKTGETINLAINKKNKVYIIHSEEGEYYTLQYNMSPESDLYCSGTGKIFLSTYNKNELNKYYEGNLEKRTVNTIVDIDKFIIERDKIIKTGIAYDNEEYEYGLTCIATSINKDNKTIAALSVSGPTTRLKFKGFDNLENKLLETAYVIEKNL